MKTHSIRYARPAVYLSLLALLLVPGIIGCKTTGGAGDTRPTEAARPATVAKVAPGTLVDMSGYWNDKDLDAAIKALAPKVLASPALVEIATKQRRKPVLRLRRIRNRSSEHINTVRMHNQFRLAMMKSGKVRIVARPGETASGKAHTPLAADFIFGGWFTSSNEIVGKKEHRAYTLSLELINVTSSEVAWTDQYRVKRILDLPPGGKKRW